jgi:thiamine biosynthesis protein ThiS
MTLYVNGENYQSDTSLTIGQLLKRLDLQPERVVLELNQTILNATENINTELHDGDKLEIIQFVGGG